MEQHLTAGLAHLSLGGKSRPEVAVNAPPPAVGPVFSPKVMATRPTAPTMIAVARKSSSSPAMAVVAIEPEVRQRFNRLIKRAKVKENDCLYGDAIDLCVDRTALDLNMNLDWLGVFLWSGAAS